MLKQTELKLHLEGLEVKCYPFSGNQPLAQVIAMVEQFILPEFNRTRRDALSIIIQETLMAGETSTAIPHSKFATRMSTAMVAGAIYELQEKGIIIVDRTARVNRYQLNPEYALTVGALINPKVAAILGDKIAVNPMNHVVEIDINIGSDNNSSFKKNDTKTKNGGDNKCITTAKTNDSNEIDQKPSPASDTTTVDDGKKPNRTEQKKTVLAEMGIEHPKSVKRLLKASLELLTKWKVWLSKGISPFEGCRNVIGWAISMISKGFDPPTSDQTPEETPQIAASQADEALPAWLTEEDDHPTIAPKIVADVPPTPKNVALPPWFKQTAETDHPTIAPEIVADTPQSAIRNPQSPPPIETVWTDVLEQAENALPRLSFATHLANSTPISLDDQGLLLVSVDNSQSVDWLNIRLKSNCLRWLELALDHPKCEVENITDVRFIHEVPPQPTLPNPQLAINTPQPPIPIPNPPSQTPNPQPQLRNPQSTIDNQKSSIPSEIWQKLLDSICAHNQHYQSYLARCKPKLIGSQHLLIAVSAPPNETLKQLIQKAVNYWIGDGQPITVAFVPI